MDACQRDGPVSRRLHVFGSLLSNIFNRHDTAGSCSTTCVALLTDPRRAQPSGWLYAASTMAGDLHADHRAGMSCIEVWACSHYICLILVWDCKQCGSGPFSAASWILCHSDNVLHSLFPHVQCPAPGLQPEHMAGRHARSRGTLDHTQAAGIPTPKAGFHIIQRRYQRQIAQADHQKLGR